jgi:hypothetical protein
MKKFACLLLLSNSLLAGEDLLQDQGKYTNISKEKSKDILCQSTKEYITVFRYLESQKAFSLKKPDMMKIADVASKGCNGAAKRLIETNDLLLKAGLETSDSLKIAMKFTEKSDQTTEAFAAIFKETFLKEYLDLDIKTSIDLSLKLSAEADGDTTMIKNDFQKIVKFCLDHKGLDLSGPKCSDLALKVAVCGTKFKMEMAPSFLEHYNYLTDKEGVDLTTYKALETSLKLIAGGPLSPNNFKDAYKFAISKTGLDLSKIEAISYAELMASRSKLESISK